MNTIHPNMNGVAKLYSKQLQKLNKQSNGKSKAIKGYADKVSLSINAQTISKLVEKTIEADDIRQDKVETLKQKIEMGTYNTDAKLVADKIVKDCLLGKLI